MNVERLKGWVTYVEHSVTEDEAEAPGRDNGPDKDEYAHGENAGVRGTLGKHTNEHHENAEREDIRNGLDQNWPPVGEDERSPDVGGAWSISTQEEIVRVLARTVEEVVADISCDTNSTVLKGADLGSLAGSRDICLHGTSARIRGGNNVGIISPEVAEQVLESLVFVAERRSSSH